VQQPQAGLEIKAGFLPLAFILYFCTPHISINGSPPIRGKWGENLIPVEPGRHQVTMWYPYAFIKQASKATLTVDVAHGQVAQLTYRPHILYVVFLPGRLNQVGVRPIQTQAAAVQPAGWHPDPSGRHELRYWNGAGWTDDVSNAGVAAKDAAG
jgi:hypothetical protein